MRSPLDRRRLAHAPGLALAILLAAGTGCATPASQGASAAERAKQDEAAAAALATLESAPLSPLRMRAAGERLLAASRPGRAHAHLRTALALVQDPPPAEAAGAAISGGSGGGSLSSSDMPPGSQDPAGPGGEEALTKLIALAEAAHTLPGTSTAAHGPARERASKAREDALRLYRERRYDRALERFEKLTRDDEPRLARFVSSCLLNLAFVAKEEGKDAEAVEHLWRAADADPSRRGDALYRDVARLERRIAVTRQGAGDMVGCDAALRRAFRAAPDDPETLYLLSRRKDLPYAERGWYEKRLARLHPDETKADFLAAAEEVRAAKDAASAGEIVDRFAAKNPQQGALTADLRSLVADKARGEAAKDAAIASERYEEAKKAAKDSRTAFESGISEEPPVESEAETPAGPAGRGE